MPPSCWWKMSSSRSRFWELSASSMPAGIPFLQGRLYSALPGQSGIVLFVSNIGGLFGAMIPFVIGAVASQWGLDVAMWLMLLGPIALIIGLPVKRIDQSIA